MNSSAKPSAFSLLSVCSLVCVLFTAIAFLSAGNAATGAEPTPSSGELGRVPILEYHLIQEKPHEWGRTPQQFRNDLEMLYAAGYRPIAMRDYLNKKIEIPVGTHPVIITFDDSSPGQFRYVMQNGKKIIDPDCAVGMMLEFKKRHPDFGARAIFFVLPAAAQPHKLFGQPEYETEKLKELVAHGFEIGNHTLWHANLKKYKEATVKKQLALAVKAVQAAVPGYEVNALALPFGAYPKEVSWAVEGVHENTRYRNRAILMVAGGPARSPFDPLCDPLRLPRIQVAGKAIERMIQHFQKNPQEVYTRGAVRGKANNVAQANR